MSSNLLAALMAVPSKQAQKQRQANKDRRHEQHRINEEERPEENRLQTRTDLEKHATAQLSRRRLTWNVKELCKFGQCSEDPDREEFKNRDEWNQHLATDHALKTLRAASFSFFCAFCDDFVLVGIEGPSARIKHYESHLIKAVDSVHKFGYNSLLSSADGRHTLSVRHPWFCIFCLHDEQLNAADRIANCNEGTGKAYNSDKKEHLQEHFMRLREDDLSHCPSLFCRSNVQYSPQEQEDHLVQEHSIHMVKNFAVAKPKLKRQRLRGKAKALADAAKIRGEEEIGMDCDGPTDMAFSVDKREALCPRDANAAL